MAQAKLTLMRLTCIKKQSTFGKDKIVVFVDGEPAGGPFTIGKAGDDVIVGGGEHEFDKEIRISLFERDGNNDDVLGSWIAYSTETDGIRQAHFHSRPGTDYHLLYDVDVNTD